VTLPEFYLKDNFFSNPANTELILTNMSVHNYKKSKFYANKDGDGKNKNFFDNHMNQIMRAVLTSEAFAKVLQAEVGNDQLSKSTRESFMGAVCVFDYKKKITIEYKKIWKSVFVKGIITNAAREAENVIREYLGIKSKLTILDWSYRAELIEIIRDYKKIHLIKTKPVKPSKGKKKQDEWIDGEEGLPAAPFEPNLQTAAQIEKESWETTNTLLELQNNSDHVIVSTIQTQPSQTQVVSISESLTSFDDEDANNNINDDNDWFGFEAINTDEPDETEEIHGIFESAEEPLSPNSDISNISDMEKLIVDLTDDELAALKMLANSTGSGFDSVSVAFMQERGVMLEAVTESVNEKAMDITGDIIFENGQIIEDYLEQIQSCL